MRPIGGPQLRRVFVDCSRGEANALTLPRSFADTPWDDVVRLA